MRVGVVIFFLLLVQLGWSQIDIEPEEVLIEEDTTYIESFRDNLMLRVLFEHKFNAIEVSSMDTNGLRYLTNNTWTQGIGFAYKWLAVDLSFRMPWAQQNSTKGETKNSSLGIGINGGKFWTRVFFENNQGYYLENVLDWNESYLDSNGYYPYRGDIRTSLIYASVNYGFNHKKYSNVAGITQQERQLKGAGSFTAGLIYARTATDADYSLVPSEYREYFNDTIAKAKHYSAELIGLNLGYLRNVPLSRNKKVLLNFVFIPGMSLQKIKLGLEDGEFLESDNVLGIHYEIRFSLGYNGNKWYYGLLVRSHGFANQYVTSSSSSQSYTYTRFYLGYKFPMRDSNSKFFKKIGF